MPLLKNAIRISVNFRGITKGDIVKYSFLAFIVFSLSACDALKNDPFKVTTTSITVAAGESPAEIAAREKCTKDWQPALEALHKLADKQSAQAFKDFSAVIPPETTPLHKCKNQSDVIYALDVQLDDLQKWAHSSFEFMVLVARVQYLGDGGLSESLCASGTELLKKDPTDFVKAIKQEKEKIKNLECFLSGTFDLVDAKPEAYAKEYALRKEVLMKVKDKDLLSTRDELLKMVPNK